MAWVRPCSSSRCRNRSISDSSGTVSYPAPRPRTPHRLAHVDRIFRGRVREVEPLLQKVEPEHLLQPNRQPPFPRPPLMRLNQPDQADPGNHRVQLGRESLPARDLPLCVPRQSCECPLLGNRAFRSVGFINLPISPGERHPQSCGLMQTFLRRHPLRNSNGRLNGEGRL